jgi:hypothetical protein
LASAARLLVAAGLLVTPPGLSIAATRLPVAPRTALAGGRARRGAWGLRAAAVAARLLLPATLLSPRLQRGTVIHLRDAAASVGANPSTDFSSSLRLISFSMSREERRVRPVLTRESASPLLQPARPARPMRCT